MLFYQTANCAPIRSYCTLAACECQLLQGMTPDVAGENSSPDPVKAAPVQSLRASERPEIGIQNDRQQHQDVLLCTYMLRGLPKPAALCCCSVMYYVLLVHEMLRLASCMISSVTLHYKKNFGAHRIHKVNWMCQVSTNSLCANKSRLKS